MGDQARQELELWQVVSSYGNAQTRQAKSRRASTQTRSDMQRRGNVSGYSRTETGNVRAAGTVRSGNKRPARTGSMRSSGTVRSEYARSSGTVRSEYTRSSGAVRSEYVRSSGAVRSASRRTVRTGNARTANPRTVRTGNARTANPVRTAKPRTRSKVQTSKKKNMGRRARVYQFWAFVWVIAMCAATLFMGNAFYQSTQKSPVVKADKPTEPSVPEETSIVENTEWKPNIREDFLTISEYNRPGTELACVKNIFVHYTANPKTSAAQNRSYFENLAQTHERAASAHFIIGYEGEIIQCIPLEEEAYAVVERNGDSISIECCYLAADGSFTKETYDSLVEMLAWLTDKYDLEPKDILRHYDCGGKLCPLYYVNHEDAWQKLLDDVAHYTL